MAISILPYNFNQFPDVDQADEYGLLAIGGNLKPETLLKAYDSGIFPWYNKDEPICWYAPPERCVLFPSHIKVSKSMQQIIKKGSFSISKNKAFESVIKACAHIERKDQDGTWIVENIQNAYLQLHRLGKASSIEVWQNNQLVGGLYGVEQGKMFCGESMFSAVANASKMALIYLCKQFDYQLIDCQIENPHLLSMGAQVIDRAHFGKLLQQLK